MLEFDPTIDFSEDSSQNKILWKAFCHFRLSEYNRACEIYLQIIKSKPSESLNDIKLLYEISKFYNGEDVDLNFIKDYDGKHKSLSKRFFAYLDIKNSNENQTSSPNSNTSAEPDKNLFKLEKLLPVVSYVHF